MLQWHRSSRVALLTKVNKLVSPSYLAVDHAYSQHHSSLGEVTDKKKKIFFFFLFLFKKTIFYFLRLLFNI